MSATYSSFLLRCWARDGQLRIEAEHVQSGRQTRESTLAAVANWIENVTGDLETVSVENEEGSERESDSADPRDIDEVVAGHALYLPCRADG